MPLHIMNRHRLLARVAAAALVATSAACGDQTGVGDLGDKTAPAVKLTQLTGPDSILAFNVKATDGLGLRNVHVDVSGGLSVAFDTTYHSAVTTFDRSFAIAVPRNVAPGTRVMVIARAVDGNGNNARPDTLTLAAGNLQTARVMITSPAPGTPVVIGKSIVLAISGATGAKVRVLGYATAGVLIKRDSTLLASPLRDSTAQSFTLKVDPPTKAGKLVITPFMTDSLGQIGNGTALVLDVMTSSSALPTARLGLNASKRMETTDTVHVDATAAAVTRVGYRIFRLDNGILVDSASIRLSGENTSTFATFKLHLPISSFPTSVRVEAFVEDSASHTATAYDTVSVVAGSTKPLPNGGTIADALYHPRTDALYLTNIERNVVEVFSLRDSSFRRQGPIIVGSRPWGIAPWPRDRAGTMSDTLIVANSGGTSLSYVNVNSNIETRRYYLPNIIVYTVTTVLSATTGAPIQQLTRHDFSDRPQYLAATCNTAYGDPINTAVDSTTNYPGLPGNPCQNVVLVYSTTPTGGQSTPFAQRGTVRWENLTLKTSHFFFEQAQFQAQGRSDTLLIERYPSNGEGAAATLVPYRQIQTQLVPKGDSMVLDSAVLTTVVNIDKLAFRDTTFVRNSGSFRRAIIAEGGKVAGSRAMTFDVSQGYKVDTVNTKNRSNVAFNSHIRDAGISRPGDVSSFIANTFANVYGAGINFDGSLSAIRADSTYIINTTLRLLGLLQTSGGNAGFDFHPNNFGDGTPGSAPDLPRNRLAFAASSEPVIEVYDTYCYRRVALIPVRDPIIGPIKSSYRASTGEIQLVGATAKGVVIVSLANNFQSSCF